MVGEEEEVAVVMKRRGVEVLCLNGDAPGAREVLESGEVLADSGLADLEGDWGRSSWEVEARMRQGQGAGLGITQWEWGQARG